MRAFLLNRLRGMLADTPHATVGATSRRPFVAVACALSDDVQRRIHASGIACVSHVVADDPYDVLLIEPNATFRALVDAFRFFRTQYPDAPVRRALKLARAEIARRADPSLRIEWDAEPDPDTSWCEDCRKRRHTHDVECAALVRVTYNDETYTETRTVLASLGNICDADDAYRRVIAAELTLEGL